MELSKITHADFEKCIDQEFSCSMGGGELRLVLAEVRDLAQFHWMGRRSTMFRSPYTS